MMAIIFTVISFLVIVSHGIGKPRSLYIHIPFCRRRCFYCNFPVQIIGERVATIEKQSALYTDILIADMRNTLNLSSWNFKDDAPLDTIYFGGGTPSMLTDECIDKIISAINDLFGISLTAEITLEMDPGTFDSDRILRLKAIGINRVSVGIQSFDEATLKSCGRAHSADDAVRAIDALRNAGMENFSIDLISSLPGMDLHKWSNTLITACNFKPPHLSVYDLQIEERSAFGRWYTPGEFPLPTEKISADMYRMAVKTLTEDFGYEHYEVSNYAQPGKRSRHNQMYWRSEPFWGFGMGAASYLNGQRFTRPSTHSEYVQWVEAIQSRKEGMLSPSESEEKTNTEEDRVLETVMLSLRTADGLDLTALPAKYRQKTVEALIPYFLEWEMEEKKGRQDEEKEKLELVQFLDNRGMALLPDSGKDWKEIISENANRVRLTDPDGFLLSNDIISSIFASISTE